MVLRKHVVGQHTIYEFLGVFIPELKHQASGNPRKNRIFESAPIGSLLDVDQSEDFERLSELFSRGLELTKLVANKRSRLQPIAQIQAVGILRRGKRQPMALLTDVVRQRFERLSQISVFCLQFAQGEKWRGPELRTHNGLLDMRSCKAEVNSG